MPQVNIGLLDPSDIDRSFAIRDRSFGLLSESGRAEAEADVRRCVEEGRAIGVYEGSLLVGRAIIRPFTQWWGGRPLLMAGIAGVLVAPEYRGRGVGSALMHGVCARAHELGFAISVLYPAIIGVYRQRGWEFAGVQAKMSIAAELARGLPGSSTAVRQATVDDSAHVTAIVRDSFTGSRACGPKEDGEAEQRETLEDSAMFTYVADRGFVTYGWEGSTLVVYQIVAADADTARALWRVVGSGSSISKRIHAYLAPDDPIHLVLGGLAEPEVHTERWMLRCIDVRAALNGRGYAPNADISVALIFDDPDISANQVSGVLRVSEGRGEFQSGSAERSALRLGPNGLALLYAGTPSRRIISLGLASGGDDNSLDALDALDAAFAGSPPYLLDYF